MIFQKGLSAEASTYFYLIKISSILKKLDLSHIIWMNLDLKTAPIEIV